MRPLTSTKLSKLAFLIFLLNISTNVLAQNVYPDVRGLYVNDFLKIYSDDVHVNPYFSILGVDAGGQNYTKEDALLEYCKQNHITHIALYDLHWLSDHLNDPYNNAGTVTYGDHLCRFINKAKSTYCIETVGATGYRDFSFVPGFNGAHFQSPVYNFPNQLIGTAFATHFSFVEQSHPYGDPLYFRAENAKMFLRLLDFIQGTGCDFDVLAMDMNFGLQVKTMMEKPILG